MDNHYEPIYYNYSMGSLVIENNDSFIQKMHDFNINNTFIAYRFMDLFVIFDLIITIYLAFSLVYRCFSYFTNTDNTNTDNTNTDNTNTDNTNTDNTSSLISHINLLENVCNNLQHNNELIVKKFIINDEVVIEFNNTLTTLADKIVQIENKIKLLEKNINKCINAIEDDIIIVDDICDSDYEPEEEDCTSEEDSDYEPEEEDCTSEEDSDYEPEEEDCTSEEEEDATADTTPYLYNAFMKATVKELINIYGTDMVHDDINKNIKNLSYKKQLVYCCIKMFIDNYDYHNIEVEFGNTSQLEFIDFMLEFDNIPENVYNYIIKHNEKIANQKQYEIYSLLYY